MLGQKDYKRLLAYSSISQVGYILFAFGLGTKAGIVAGLFHLINHSALKSLLFLNSGAVVYNTDTRDMEQLGGLAKKMPVTATTSLIGSLSLSGIPPFGGFWSKWLIILAAVQGGEMILAGVAAFVSIVTLAYYLKSQKMVFYGQLLDKYQKIKEVPFFMCVSMILLAIICVGLGVLLIPQFQKVILDPAVNVIEGGLNISKMVTGG